MGNCPLSEGKTNINSHNDTGCAIANAYCALEAVSYLSTQHLIYLMDSGSHACGYLSSWNW